MRVLRGAVDVQRARGNYSACTPKVVTRNTPRSTRGVSSTKGGIISLSVSHTHSHNPDHVTHPSDPYPPRSIDGNNTAVLLRWPTALAAVFKLMAPRSPMFYPNISTATARPSRDVPRDFSMCRGASIRCRN